MSDFASPAPSSVAMARYRWPRYQPQPRWQTLNLTGLAADTALETRPGWRKTQTGTRGVFVGSTAGHLSVNSVGTPAAPNLALLFDTGCAAHAIEATILLEDGVTFPLVAAASGDNNYLGIRFPISPNEVEVRTLLEGNSAQDAVYSRGYEGANGLGRWRIQVFDDGQYDVCFQGSVIYSGRLPSRLIGNTEVGIVIRGNTVRANYITDLRILSGEVPRGRFGVGAWTQQHYPGALIAHGKVYVGPAARTSINHATDQNLGEIRATVTDLNTLRQTVTPLRTGLDQDNHHHHLTFLRRPDGRILAFTTNHGADGLLRCWLEVAPGSGTWSAEASVNLTGTVTYHSPVMHADRGNMIRVYVRRSDAITYVESPNLATVAPPSAAGQPMGTITWLPRVDLVPPFLATDKGNYHRVVSDGRRIDYFAVVRAHSAGSGPKQDLRFLKLDAVTNRVFAFNDTPLAPVFAPVAWNQLELIYDSLLDPATGNELTPGQGRDVWQRDMTVSPDGLVQILFNRFPLRTDARYHELWLATRRPGEPAWKVVEIVEARSRSRVPSTSGEDFYATSGCLDPDQPGLIYYAVGTHNASQLYRIFTRDRGDSFDPPTLISPPVPANDSYGGQYILPIVPAGRDPRCEVLFLGGRSIDFNAASTVGHALTVFAHGQVRG